MFQTNSWNRNNHSNKKKYEQERERKPNPRQGQDQQQELTHPHIKMSSFQIKNAKHTKHMEVEDNQRKIGYKPKL